VAFGAVLGAAWSRSASGCTATRQPGGRVALVATGFATLYLVDAAATAIFGFLPALPALALRLAVAGRGPGPRRPLAQRAARGGVCRRGACLAPALADGRLLVAAGARAPARRLLVVLRRRWAVLMLLAAAGPVSLRSSALSSVERAASPSLGVAAACS
jgi:hypothetical protein